jgi:hypothetical protein
MRVFPARTLTRIKSGKASLVRNREAGNEETHDCSEAQAEEALR